MLLAEARGLGVFFWAKPGEKQGEEQMTENRHGKSVASERDEGG